MSDSEQAMNYDSPR
ncbi:hypothetical protein [Bacillus subtilis]